MTLKRNIYTCPMCGKHFDHRGKRGGVMIPEWVTELPFPSGRPTFATMMQCPNCHRRLWMEDFSGPPFDTARLTDDMRRRFGISLDTAAVSS